MWRRQPHVLRAQRTTRIFLQMNPSRNAIRKVLADQLRDQPGVKLVEHLMASPAAALEEMRRAVLCVAPAGDSSSFCVRFYFALLSGCIPVRVDTYGAVDSYPYTGALTDHLWPRVVVRVVPEQLKRVGLVALLANVSDVPQRLRDVRAIRDALVYNARGDAPDAFSMVLRQLAARKVGGGCLTRAKELAVLWGSLGRRCQQELPRRVGLELSGMEERCLTAVNATAQARAADGIARLRERVERRRVACHRAVGAHHDHRARGSRGGRHLHSRTVVPS